MKGRPPNIYLIAINNNGCWEWQGGSLVSRYPMVGIPGTTKRDRVSRLVLAAKLGRPIFKDLEACHICDNPPCVNPDHLWEGTHQQNMTDMAIKKRNQGTKGSKNFFATITENDVIEIRKLAAAKINHRIIAKQFGISRDHVRKINTRKLWKHVA